MLPGKPHPGVPNGRRTQRVFRATLRNLNAPVRQAQRPHLRVPPARRSTRGPRVSSRIVAARAVAAEVTRRKCFSCQNPPPYVGGYLLELTLRCEHSGPPGGDNSAANG